jgi:type II restriction/modification system DNA methylase subunit YeeA
LVNCRDEEERKRTEEIIKPVLRGRDIERYRYKWAGLWIIIIPAGWTNKHRGREKPEEFFKRTFPALYNHFMNFANVKGKGKGLFDRDDQGDYWWELRPCDYYPEFEKEKIVWQRITKSPKFAIVPSGYYCEATTHFITTNEDTFYIRRYLLGIFNSKFFEFAFYKFYMGGGIEGEIKGEFIGRYPIPPITKENQPLADQIVQKVDHILSLTQSPDYEINKEKQEKVKELEREIDQLVYKLYGLTEEEIKIIEGGYHG